MDKNFRNFLITGVIFIILVAIHISLNTFISLPYKFDLFPLIAGAGFLFILSTIILVVSLFIESKEDEKKRSPYFLESAYLDAKYADLFKNNNIDINEGSNAETINEVKELLRDKLENISAESYFQDFKNKIRADLIVENFEYKIKSIESRVQGEIERLSRSGIINLSLGMMLSVGGIGYLGFFVVNVQKFINIEEMVINTFPKAIFVLLIEVFAYFFLKLYKQSLDDIKYYQNELTNIESKNLAVYIAKQSNNHKLLTLCVEEFLGTERNFILEKDQSTIEIEKERISSNNTNNTLQVVKDIFKK
ncbi:hypothetical protein [Acinetobacter pittii]|uniref:hypothetical protein n=1 Tax=Acinetobacter pittii TaxID=48296 RepID=UPI0008386FCF|nr:hypothetical protein [Acinetobacter pittii]OCY50362.1 hypothetical protein BFR81_12395 [Acinetobacter pittii]